MTIKLSIKRVNYTNRNLFKENKDRILINVKKNLFKNKAINKLKFTVLGVQVLIH